MKTAQTTRDSRRRPTSPPATDAKDDVKPAKFDGDRAMKYLKQLCDIGPRISGSEGMKKQQELIEKHFKDLGRDGHAAGVQGQADAAARPRPRW